MSINKENASYKAINRRRRWSVSKKIYNRKTYLPGMSISLIARKYNIIPSQLFSWRRQMEDGALKGISTEEELVPLSRLKELEKRLKDTERVLGRKTLENEILREAVKIAQEKNSSRGNHCPGWKISHSSNREGAQSVKIKPNQSTSKQARGGSLLLFIFGYRNPFFYQTSN